MKRNLSLPMQSSKKRIFVDSFISNCFLGQDKPCLYIQIFFSENLFAITSFSCFPSCSIFNRLSFNNYSCIFSYAYSFTHPCNIFILFSISFPITANSPFTSFQFIIFFFEDQHIFLELPLIFLLKSDLNFLKPEKFCLFLLNYSCNIFFICLWVMLLFSFILQLMFIGLMLILP